MEKNKKRRHFICEKFPVLAMVLSIFCITVLISILDELSEWVSGGNTAIYHILAALVAFVLLLIIELWFKPDYKGSIKSNTPIVQIMSLLILFIIYWGINFILSFITGTLIFKPTLESLGMALNAGMSEEIMFRAVTIPIGLHFIKSEKRVTLTWIITSIIFGVVHLVNIQGGGAISVIIVQAIATTFMGIYFASLFMCTGNILIPIIIHSVWDYYCFVTDGTLENGIMMQSSVDVPLIIACSINIVIGILSIMYIQKNQTSIKQIWDEKWIRKEI